MKNIYGGGALTTENGLHFEQETSLFEAIKNNGFEYEKISSKKSSYAYRLKENGETVGLLLQKHRLYSDFLDKLGINHKKYLSKKLLPDDALVNFKNKTVYIIEKKFQNTAGSVDEKLQTCDFKKKQYQKLFAPAGYQTEYIYVCNDWFKKEEYKDVIDYIQDSKCSIFFNEIPLNVLCL